MVRFGFLLRTVVMTCWRFSCCRAVLTQSQGLSSLSCCPASRGCSRSWEGTEPGQLTHSAKRDVPRRLASCSSIKAGLKKQEGVGGTFRVMAFAFTRDHDVWLALLCWKWLNTCWWEAVKDSLFCFAWVYGAFALPNKLSSSQPMSSYTFTFPILFPIPLEESEQWNLMTQMLLCRELFCFVFSFFGIS